MSVKYRTIMQCKTIGTQTFYIEHGGSGRSVFRGGHLHLVSPSGDSCWLDQLGAEMGREDGNSKVLQL